MTQIICRHSCTEGKATVSSCLQEQQQKETLKTTEDKPMGWEMLSILLLVQSRKARGT